MAVDNNPACETCAERGRERPGIHPVGSGYLCTPCWKGQGSRAERATTYASASEAEARRRYREKNRALFAEYQRRYRERKRAEKDQACVGNQVLYEAGPDAEIAAPGP
jgi:hypothetical protein